MDPALGLLASVAHGACVVGIPRTKDLVSDPDQGALAGICGGICLSVAAAVVGVRITLPTHGAAVWTAEGGRSALWPAHGTLVASCGVLRVGA